MPHSHSHHHAHHHHAHSSTATRYTRAFAIGTALNLGFVVVEGLTGIFINSLALLADAGHNLSDVLGLLLAWGASFLAQRPPTQRFTYGFRRSSILAALINSTILLLAMGAIAWESIQRLMNPSPISSGTVIIVASVGVVINTVSALLFVKNDSHDLNIRGAFLHLAADALVSLGVVLAGIAIWLTDWLWFDPVVSLIIVVVVVVSTWQLLQGALKLALDAVPEHIEPLAVRTYLAELAGVRQVHDLHVWAMSTTEIALTAHLVMPDGHPGDEFLGHVCQSLHQKFGIGHSTLQIETGDSDGVCHLESDDVV